VIGLGCAVACSDDTSEPPRTQDPPVSRDAGLPACAHAFEAGELAEPMPEDVQFSLTNPLPTGEQILFNDWNPIPNVLHSIRPDGTGETEILRVYRIWSLAASNDGKTLAFSSGDPLQEQHYGITLGDAIQHTWLFDVATSRAKVLAWGNVNDECHTFSAQDDRLWLCRRSGFGPGPDFDHKSYHLATISPEDCTLSFPTSPADGQLELHPRPAPDGSALYYTLIDIVGASQRRRIVKKKLPDGEIETLRENANLSQLSPDGTRLLFSDYGQEGKLMSMNLDGNDVIKVADRAGTSAVYSPDGSRVAYLYSTSQSCSHVEIVAADGTLAGAPKRIRECGTAFITDLAWLSAP
jgi:hypothetical protein